MSRWIDALHKLVETELDLMAELSLEEALQKIVDMAAPLAQARYGALGVLDETGNLGQFYFTGVEPEAFAKIGRPPDSMAALLGDLLREGKTLRLKDLTQHPKFSGFPPHHPIGRSFMGVPIRHWDQILGNLYLMEKVGPEEFSEEDEALVTAFAAQAALVIQNTRLFQETQEHLAKLQAFYEAAKLLTSERLVDALLQQAVEGAARAVGAKYGAIGLVDEEGRLKAFIHTGLSPQEAAKIGRMPEGKGILGALLREGLPLRLDDLTQDPRAYGFPAHHPPMKSFLGIPITARGKVLGRLYLTEKEGGPFTAEDDALLISFAEIIAGLIENARLHENLRLAAIQLEARVEDRTRELQEAMRQIDEASRHKSEFLANMSHELRTPLNSILGFAEVLREQNVGPLNEKQARYVNHVWNSGKHLLQLINDILDLAKVEAGKFVLQPESLPVASTLEDILVIARGLAHKKGQTVVAEIEPDLPPLRADPVRFKQILFNLLSNAVKFTPEGGQITVTVRRVPGIAECGLRIAELPATDTVPQSAIRDPQSEIGECLEIRVGDTGPGIKPEDLPRLFQEFVQLKATQTQRHEGTGLGLALTKRLVEMHGGRIWAESEGEGRGSTFTVVLPFGGPGSQQGTE